MMYTPRNIVAELDALEEISSHRKLTYYEEVECAILELMLDSLYESWK